MSLKQISTGCSVTGDNQVLCTRYLKDAELYISNGILQIAHKEHEIFTLDLGYLRCATPISGDTVRIFWRIYHSGSSNDNHNRNNNNNLQQSNRTRRYQYDITLDLKRMFSNKRQRRLAYTTESKKLANMLLDISQMTHKVKEPNRLGYLAMHAQERIIKSFDGECKFGKGTLFLTNLGMYFVTGHGLCFDMPLDILDSHHAKNKTVIIYYFEPTWGNDDGYDKPNKKHRKIEIRIKGVTAHAVSDSIAKVYSDSGAQEARQLSVLTEQFGMMSADELYFEYYDGGKHDDTVRPIHNYISLLAQRQWGTPTTQEVADSDAAVIRVCLFTGTPIDVAGDLTDKDRQFREDTIKYHEQYMEYKEQFDALWQDAAGLITANLSEEDATSVLQCNPYVILDTIIEFAKTKKISDKFTPASAIHWQQYKKNTDDAIISQELSDYPYGVESLYNEGIPCPWSVDDAKAIVANPDFLAMVDTIESLNQKYDMRIYTNSRLFAKTFEREQRYEISLRVRRVYDHWCKTNNLQDLNLYDTTDTWIQLALSNLNLARLEAYQRHFGYEATPADELREAEMASQNTLIRLERAVKPAGIPDCDIYTDAWHDRERRLWFTTNPYPRISESGVQTMNFDECEQKFGYRATVFLDSVVKLKHGYPAVYDKDKGWWVLLCTMWDRVLTRRLVNDKRMRDTLRYNNVEPVISIADDGSLAYETEGEYVLESVIGNNRKKALPINERIRRFIFTYAATHTVKTVDEDYTKDLQFVFE